MLERDLLPDYSPDVLAEVAGLQAPAGPDPAARDLRTLPWVSIDNDSSRDLDQISAAEELAGGQVKIRVGIADVDALVAVGSAIDRHAEHNTTSVYTAAGIFAMLPEKLSTGLTSLNEDGDRRAMVVEMVFDADGEMLGSDVYPASVRNQAKLAYDSVAAWLDGSGPAPAAIADDPTFQEQLRIQDRMAQKLRAIRHRHGALGLETLEARPVFDGDELADLRIEPKNRGRELIEDLMIAANGAVAAFLAGKGMPSLRRILRSPQRWGRIVDLASREGGHLPPHPDAASLERFLAERKKADPEGFGDLSLAVVKLIGSGEYALNLPGHHADGHFGLAVSSYTHSTAPNRRFPDLITQRLVKAALAGDASPYATPELERLASRCTTMEDAAAKVERRVRKSAAALLMASRIGERFDAVVTGASEKGTWVRLRRPPVEGKLVRGAHGLDVGDRLPVTLLATDVDRGYVDFAAAHGH